MDFCYLASCAVIRPWESILIGGIGALITILGTDLLEMLKIDDPVGATSTHAFAGIWVRIFLFCLFKMNKVSAYFGHV